MFDDQIELISTSGGEFENDINANSSQSIIRSGSYNDQRSSVPQTSTILKKKGRLVHYDGLRGIAALFVVVSHAEIDTAGEPYQLRVNTYECCQSHSHLLDKPPYSN